MVPAAFWGAITRLDGADRFPRTGLLGRCRWLGRLPLPSVASPALRLCRNGSRGRNSFASGEAERKTLEARPIYGLYVGFSRRQRTVRAVAASEWPELTNWPSGTHKQTKQEHHAALA